MDSIKSLFSRVKWPGWFAIIVAAITWIPDWQSRIQFWLETAKMLGGHLGLVAAIVASPFFSPGLLVLGLTYLFVTAELEKPIRHPIWPILGWVVFGSIAIIFWSILVAGYVGTHLPKQAAFEAMTEVKNLAKQNLKLQARLDETQSQLNALRTPWNITPDQEKKLDSELSKPGVIFPNKIDELWASTNSQFYAGRLTSIFQRHGYKGPLLIGGDNIRPDLRGLYIGIAPELAKQGKPPSPAIAFGRILSVAGIPFNFASQAGVGVNDFTLAVGDKPL